MAAPLDKAVDLAGSAVGVGGAAEVDIAWDSEGDGTTGCSGLSRSDTRPVLP